jgi:hypothetical protein
MLNICHPSGLAEGSTCENGKAIQAMFRIVAAALILLVSAWSPTTAAAKRVALVIGMSDYQHLSKLPNPVPDAKAIAAERATVTSVPSPAVLALASASSLAPSSCATTTTPVATATVPTTTAHIAGKSRCRAGGANNDQEQAQDRSNRGNRFPRKK